MQEPTRGILRFPDSFSPQLMRLFLDNFKTVIENENGVTIGDTFFKAKTPLIIGESVILKVMKWHILVFYEKEEMKWKDYWFLKEKEEQELEEKSLQTKVIVFFDSYNFPFKYCVQHKEVLSGLGANSNGNGCSKRTVEHIFLQQDFTDGKFKRLKDNFLCSPVKSKSHGNWSGQLNRESERKSIVTCKQCLKLIEKYKK